MRRANVEVHRERLQTHSHFADVSFRITTQTPVTEVRWSPMINAGCDCDDEYESRLLNAFFAGFRDSLPSELAVKNYCIEVLVHSYHEVDSSEHAYQRVGMTAAEWFAKFPDVFHSEVA